MANPKQVYELLREVKNSFPEQTFNLHFHNTRGMGLANILAGLQAGVTSFDTALGGLGAVLLLQEQRVMSARKTLSICCIAWESKRISVWMDC